jgi:hypothetical protein
MDRCRLYIAVPLMDELESLPELLENVSAQDMDDFKVFFCVNQPDAWWEDTEKRGICERNLLSMEYIETHADFPFRVIDRCSKGKGWKGKSHGVGWARKVVMDTVSQEAAIDDIIISLDGDTAFSESYFSSVLENFAGHPGAVGLSVPYYHRLTGRDPEDRSILRYEIYMRNYAANLWRIGNPYHFTALGSAMALPAGAYMTIGGMSPKKSGEDFYFLQKLVKYGRLLTWNPEKVYPAARFSDRVFFGTGPAMIKGAAGNWSSYPVYHHSLFDEVKQTYDAFDSLYSRDIPTPMGDYMHNIPGQDNIWQPLRKNARTPEQFRKACTDRIDGLRILQFLKYSQEKAGFMDEECLFEYFSNFHPDEMEKLSFVREGYTFEELSVNQLDMIRNSLAGIEENYQKANHGQ